MFWNIFEPVGEHMAATYKMGKMWRILMRSGLQYLRVSLSSDLNNVKSLQVWGQLLVRDTESELCDLRWRELMLRPIVIGRQSPSPRVQSVTCPLSRVTFHAWDLTWPSLLTTSQHWPRPGPVMVCGSSADTAPGTRRGLSLCNDTHCVCKLQPAWTV